MESILYPGLPPAHDNEVARTRAEYEERRLTEILDGQPLPEDCYVQWGWENHISYAGEGPEPVFKRLGQVGVVVYEAESGTMKPRLRWEEVEEVNQDWERHRRSRPV